MARSLTTSDVAPISASRRDSECCASDRRRCRRPLPLLLGAGLRSTSGSSAWIPSRVCLVPRPQRSLTFQSPNSKLETNLLDIAHVHEDSRSCQPAPGCWSVCHLRSHTHIRARLSGHQSYRNRCAHPSIGSHSATRVSPSACVVPSVYGPIGPFNHARIAVGVRGAICVWTHRAIRPRAYRRRRAWCHVYGPIGPFGHARIAVGVRGAICVWTHRAIRPRAYRRRRAWCHLCMDP